MNLLMWYIPKEEMKSIWRIRLTEETRSVFEVGSEQLHQFLI